MTQYVIIHPDGGGVITHTNVDTDNMNLPNGAEIYNSREEFTKVLNEQS